MPGLAANRPWVGSLLTTVAEAKPRAVGLDFFYINPVNEKTDTEFAATLRSLPAPLVLIAVGSDIAKTEAQKKFKKDFLESVNRKAGHFYLESAQELLILGDKAIRFVNHDDTRGAGYPSFTSQIATLPEVVQVFGPPPPSMTSGLQRIDWLRPPRSGNDTFQRTYAQDFMAASPEARQALIKDKIVLIGAQFNDRTDRHMTPLSIDSRNDFPGVTIHAQILAQLLEGRAVMNWPLLAQFALLFAIGFGGVLVGRSKSTVWADIGIGVLGTGIILGLSVLFFYIRAPMPTNLAIFAWAIGITIGRAFSDSLKARPVEALPVASVRER